VGRREQRDRCVQRGVSAQTGAAGPQGQWGQCMQLFSCMQGIISGGMGKQATSTYSCHQRQGSGRGYSPALLHKVLGLVRSWHTEGPSENPPPLSPALVTVKGMDRPTFQSHQCGQLKELSRASSGWTGPPTPGSCTLLPAAMARVGGGKGLVLTSLINSGQCWSKSKTFNAHLQGPR
jgi:hypothetical protein